MAMRSSSVLELLLVLEVLWVLDVLAGTGTH